MSAQPLSQLIAPDWADALAPVADRIAAMGDFLRAELAAGRGYFPAGANVLRAFTRPLGDVRVRVPVGRRAVGRPARVADRDGAPRQRMRLDLGLEVDDLARALAPLDAALVRDGHPRRVIASVLQAAQAAQNHIEAATISQVSNDSTHAGNRTLLLRVS